MANVDFNHNNYGSVDSEYRVFDAKVNYKVEKDWTLSAGVDNIGRWKYYVNPNPYNQRTFFIGLRYDLGGPEGGANSCGSRRGSRRRRLGDRGARGQIGDTNRASRTKAARSS